MDTQSSSNRFCPMANRSPQFDRTSGSRVSFGERGSGLAAFPEQIYPNSKTRVLTLAVHRTRDLLLGKEHPDSRLHPKKFTPVVKRESLLWLHNGLAIYYWGKSIRTRGSPRRNVQPASRERPHRAPGERGARFPNSKTRVRTPPKKSWRNGPNRESGVSSGKSANLWRVGCPFPQK